MYRIKVFDKHWIRRWDIVKSDYLVTTDPVRAYTFDTAHIDSVSRAMANLKIVHWKLETIEPPLYEFTGDKALRYPSSATNHYIGNMKLVDKNVEQHLLPSLLGMTIKYNNQKYILIKLGDVENGHIEVLLQDR